jgi:hypothetical protein
MLNSDEHRNISPRYRSSLWLTNSELPQSINFVNTVNPEAFRYQWRNHHWGEISMKYAADVY